MKISIQKFLVNLSLTVIFGFILLSCRSAQSTIDNSPLSTFNSTPTQKAKSNAGYSVTPCSDQNDCELTTIIQAIQGELPAAPNGYTWKVLPEITGAILFPDGWNFLTEFVCDEETGNTKTISYFVSKENIDEVGYYSTGLTFHTVFEDSIVATEYADAFLRLLLVENKDSIEEVLFYDEDYFHGVFEGSILRVKMYVPNNDNTNVLVLKNIHYLVFGNKETNALYIIYFESLSENWVDAWEIGTTILSTMALGLDT